MYPDHLRIAAETKYICHLRRLRLFDGERRLDLVLYADLTFADLVLPFPLLFAVAKNTCLPFFAPYLFVIAR
jgi:hypothetical protein